MLLLLKWAEKAWSRRLQTQRSHRIKMLLNRVSKSNLSNQSPQLTHLRCSNSRMCKPPPPMLLQMLFRILKPPSLQLQQSQLLLEFLLLLALRLPMPLLSTLLSLLPLLKLRRPLKHNRLLLHRHRPLLLHKHSRLQPRVLQLLLRPRNQIPQLTQIHLL